MSGELSVDTTALLVGALLTPLLTSDDGALLISDDAALLISEL